MSEQYGQLALVTAIVSLLNLALYYKTGSTLLILDVLMYGLVVILMIATIARMRRPS